VSVKDVSFDKDEDDVSEVSDDEDEVSDEDEDVLDDEVSEDEVSDEDEDVLDDEDEVSEDEDDVSVKDTVLSGFSSDRLDGSKSSRSSIFLTFSIRFNYICFFGI
jgi:hypothetical protein